MSTSPQSTTDWVAKQSTFRFGLYGPQQDRAGAHGLRAEPRADAEAGAGVEGHADDRDVDAVEVLDVRAAREGAHAGVAGREEGVGGAVPGRRHAWNDPCMRLDGKRVIITGGTAGIGLATVRILTELGGRVLAVSRTEPESLPHRAPLHLVADIGEREAAVAIAEGARELLGGADVLVNNAAQDHTNLILDTSDDEIDAVLAINLAAPIRVTREVARRDGRAGHGRLDHQPLVPPRDDRRRHDGHLRRRQGRHQRLHPARRDRARAVRDPRQRDRARADRDAAGGASGWPSQDDPEAFRERVTAQIPQGRIGAPDEVAWAIAWLASDVSPARDGHGDPDRRRVHGGMTRVAVVTGGSSGMGAACVRRYLGRGVRGGVARPGAGRRRRRARDPARRHRRRWRWQAAAERVTAELGAPVALVNAAGVYPPTTLETATVELYRRVFDSNVLGTVLATQAFAPRHGRRRRDRQLLVHQRVHPVGGPAAVLRRQGGDRRS